jgi:hypothetical protein
MKSHLFLRLSDNFPEAGMYRYYLRPACARVSSVVILCEKLYNNPGDVNIHVGHKGKDYQFDLILDPQALIEAIKNK